MLHLDLYDTSTEEDVHINQVLIDEGFALFQEESRASKVTEARAFYQQPWANCVGKYMT